MEMNENHLAQKIRRPYCCEEIYASATKCRFCYTLLRQPSPSTQHILQPQDAAPFQQVINIQQNQFPLRPHFRKSKWVAGWLAILLGGLGFHKFYLGKPIQGILYLLFCWTYIPAIIGLLEGICYFSMTPEFFWERYG